MNDNFSLISLIAEETDISVLGTNQIKVSNGSAIFDDLTFEGMPLSNHTLWIVSKSINVDELSQFIDTSNSWLYIKVAFWECEVGEWISDESCDVCSTGSYSFFKSSEKCESCLEHSTCDGGSKVELDEGYWRKYWNSTNVY